MTEATQVDAGPAKRAASARKPRVPTSGRTPRVPQQSVISTEPSAEARLGEIATVSFAPPAAPATEQQVAYPEAVARQRAATARGRRASAPRRNGPVESRNVLDDLPLALRRLVVRTGDVRKVAQFTMPSGARGIEMDLATARSLSLLP